MKASGLLLALVCTAAVGNVSAAIEACSAETKAAEGDKYAAMMSGQSGKLEAWKSARDPAALDLIKVIKGWNTHGMTQLVLPEDERTEYDFEAEFTEYAQTLWIFGVYGIVMGALAVVIAPFLFAARLCCQACCCKARKGKGEYTAVEKYIPLALFNIFALISAGFAVSGVSGIGEMVSGATTTTCEMEDWVSTADTWLNTTADAFMDFAVGDSPAEVVEGSPAINGHAATAFIQWGILDALGTEIQAAEGERFGSDPDIYAMWLVLLDKVEAVQTTVQGADTGCDADWAGASYKTAIAAEMSADVEEWNKAHLMVGTNLMDNKMDVLFGSFVGAGMFSVVSAMFESVGTDAITSFHGTVIEPAASNGNYAYIFFATCFLTMFNGLFAIVAELTVCCKFDDAISDKCIDCSWGLHLIFAIVLFFLVGVFAPVSFVVGDTCAFLQDFPDHAEDYVSAQLYSNETLPVPGDAIDLLNSCFHKDATNDTLFQTLIFPSVWNATDPTSFFEMDWTDFDAAVAAGAVYTKLNELMGIVAADAAAGTCHPTEMNELDGMLKVMWTPNFDPAGATFDDDADNLEAPPDVPLLAHLLERMKRSATANKAYLALAKAARDAAGAGGGCTFFRKKWDATLGGLCEEALGGFSTLTTAMMVIGLFTWPQVITAIYIGVRMHGDGQGGQVSPGEGPPSRQ